MYMAYGWPQVIPLEPGAWSVWLLFPLDRIIYLIVINCFLLLVTPSHMELWSSSQHKVRLGKHTRNLGSIQTKVENSLAIWSPDTTTIVILTSLSILHIYKVQFSGMKLLVGGKHSSGLFLATISLVITEMAPFADKNLITSNFVCDNKSLLIGLSGGCLQFASWNGEFSDGFKPFYHPSAYQGDRGGASSTESNGKNAAIVQLEFSLALRMLFNLYSDGCVALCSTSKKGLRLVNSLKIERWLNTPDAICASMASNQRIIAIGCWRGVVELYDLVEGVSHLRTVSVYDWGYSVEDTGPVSCIAWTPDNCAFAVGWKYRGLAVWSVSGCRLMCTIRQIGINSVSSPVVISSQDLKCEPFLGATSVVHWDEYGYKLYAVEESSSERIVAFSFGKYCLNRGLSGTTYGHQVIYGEDRVLLVQPDDTDELKMLHMNLPVSYVSQNWPLSLVVTSKDGMYLAVVGQHGLILYDLCNKKWHVFGDVTQEQKIECKGLLWLGKIIVVCNYNETSNSYELLFFPRYHLDQISLLNQRSLLGKPIVMDFFRDYILVTYYPFDVHIFHVKILEELSPSTSPVLQVKWIVLYCCLSSFINEVIGFH
ncbi:LOW QUALITY PROTEIN: guanine nucleotide exchange factor subunit Rich-like [Dioscorea cayenensis subsp. rotundata]|uniref:LOW QUALITY PROTEIN: guanine nucleotide exchange factor subunit Rich-like n=1 Tax=Dioscorea cayennensis subsp. rotundata TaxID=55577 RepID=A0AB40ALW2_DIOCR|nr:LOW QUALITY PROTEIN: guanine nucleotide exchange factor subunit Rich-like [Dioscorea cayenensis subsp. rotundata]